MLAALAPWFRGTFHGNLDGGAAAGGLRNSDEDASCLTRRSASLSAKLITRLKQLKNVEGPNSPTEIRSATYPGCVGREL